MAHTLEARRAAIVTRMLGLYKRAGAGHIGSSLSCVEILIQICAGMSESDVLILSKGHAAGALYSVLTDFGKLDPNLLDTFYVDGTLLAAHPPCQSVLHIPGIPFGTGSLGHGLSLAAGLALAFRLKNQPDRRVFAVLSDGECNEGSTWEAALFAAHHKLSNLFAVVDRNGIQGFGRTEEVLDLGALEEKWRAFGFETSSIENGNSLPQVAKSLEAAINSKNTHPKCLIARTVKGHGVSYMENTVDWHYLPMSEAQYETALVETRELAK